MAKAKKKVKKTKPIVIGHLEKVSSGIFDKYQKQITDMIKGRHGVYALYKGSNLYYIGLASNLKSRSYNSLPDNCFDSTIGSTGTIVVSENISFLITCSSSSRSIF